jgi:predicted metallo-beta-lactamase superfamily hydrolase
VCNTFFKKSDTPRALDLVVAVRPQRRSKVWFVSPTQGAKDDAQLAKLRALLEAVPAPEVIDGPVLFAMIEMEVGAIHESGLSKLGFREGRDLQ